jgi:hypothetical protein
VQHVTDPVLAGEPHPGDLGRGHPLAREQDHLCPPPGHHRTTAAPHDPQQPVAFVVGHRSKLHRPGHPHLLGSTAILAKDNQASKPALPAISHEQGERCRQGH